MSSSKTSLWSRLPFRIKVALVVSLVTIFATWSITPTAKTLYLPKDHVIPDQGDPSQEGIVNTIVVPSYNEAENMQPLVSRIFQSLPSTALRETEVLIIDDASTDATSEVIERLREEGYNVHLHVRTTERGLSSAVLYGFSLAKGSKLLVMDADLQHPPEKVPELLAALRDNVEEGKGTESDGQGDFVLATRYGKGGGVDKDWPMYRKLISWGARMLARPLTSANDPMGGFFALRKDLYLRSAPLNPSGFKLGLELLLKTPLTSTGLVHVPYGFSKRLVGSSKLGMSTMLKYVGQLLALYTWKWGFLPFYGLIGIVAAVGTWSVLKGLEVIVRRRGWQDNALGRRFITSSSGPTHKRRKSKWEV